jgi:hypothetical protein
MLAAYPMLVQNVYVGSLDNKRKLIAHFGGKALLSSDYEVSPRSLATRPIPNSVSVENVGTLMQRRSVNVLGRPRPVDLTSQSLVSLQSGRSTMVRLTGTDQTIELTPNLPLTGGEYTVMLDPQGEDKLLQTGMVSVAGFGEKIVNLNQSALSTFILSGQTTTNFVENRSARLTLVRSAWGATNARVEVIKQPDTNAMFGENAPLNVADRYKLVLATRSSPMAVLDSSMQAPPSSNTGERVIPQLPSRGSTANPEPGNKLAVYVYLPFRQQWTLKGYSRGALLNVISLAPQEEATIEVFSWQRLKTQNERASSFEGEMNLEAGLTNKDSAEVVNEVRHEKGWKFDVNGGVSAGKIPVQLNVSGGYDDKLAKASKTTGQRIMESTVKASSKIKNTRQTKVMESTESGSETRVTRRLRNPNMGHTLNLDCFEVLANYEVETSVDEKGVRLGVALPMTDILEPMLTAASTDKAATTDQRVANLVALLAYEHVLSPKVPAALRSGFQGARTLLTNLRLCHFKCEPKCTCPNGTLDEGNTSKPATPEAAALERLMASATELKTAIDTLINAAPEDHVRVAERGLKSIVGLTAPPTMQEWEAARRKTRQYLYRKLVLESVTSRFWGVAIETAGKPWTEASINKLIGARAVHAADALNVALLIAQRGPKLISEAGLMLLTAAAAAADMTISGSWGIDDAGLDSALNQTAQIGAELAEIRKPVVPQGGAPAVSKDANDPLDKLAEQPEFSDKDLAEAMTNLEVLIRHLKDNDTYFRALLWNSISPEDRIDFVSQFGEVQKLVTGTILSTVGTSVIFELSYDAPGVAQYLSKLNLGQMREVSTDKADVELPTPAVTLEARLGTCDALEPFLKSSRNTEIKRLAAVAKQQEMEADRMERRIKTDMLDDPKPAAPVLLVERVPAP